MKRITRWLVGGWLAASLVVATGFSQTTEFTYQGVLKASAEPAFGVYDLQFKLFDDPVNGTQIGGTATKAAVSINEGLFSVSLNFGDAFDGADRYLEIGVRTSKGGGSYTTLSPRQKLRSTPYAITARNVTGTIPSGAFGGTYAGEVALTNVRNTFAGSGAALTQLNATQMKSGTVPDARLSANVAKLDTPQTFTANNNFSGNVGIGVPSATQSLDVDGQIRVRGGSPGASKVLTSDANGNATWNAQRALASVVVVDANGNGDHTTIGAALAVISPSASNPHVIDVRAGTYTERVIMKSHVHLRGAGIESTIILFDETGASNDEDFAVIRLNQLSNVQISDLTLAGATFANPASNFDPAMGILDEESSPIVRNVRITELVGTTMGALSVEAFGIYSYRSSPVLENSILDSPDAADGISLFQSSARISGNTFGPQYHGVHLQQSSALIAGNLLTNVAEGIYISGSTSSATIVNNMFYGDGNGTRGVLNNNGRAIITGNQFLGALEYGIYNEGESTIVANHFEGATRSAIFSLDDFRSTMIGNTFLNCGGSGEFAAGLHDSSAVFSGNAFSGSPFGDIKITGGGEPAVNGNITTGSVSGLATLANHSGATIKSQDGALMITTTNGVSIGDVVPDAPLTIEDNNATDSGGVSSFPEVMLHMHNTLVQHTAASVDARTGKDAILYLAENGEARWGIRHDNDQGNELDIRYHAPGGSTTEALKLSTGGNLTIAGALSQSSDRNLKTDINPVESAEVLEKVLDLPLHSWVYKSNPSVRHVGPMAQDFYSAFELGADEKHIAALDADGVALAAIQGLNEKLKTELDARDLEIEELRAALDELRSLVDSKSETSSADVR